MKIIPVLDLRQGLVVHAVKGERDRYQPVESILSSSADPLEVAGGLQQETGCRELYIADLDVIQNRGHNRDAIREIAHRLDAELWVDAGVADPESANQVISAGTNVVIVGSETLSDLEQLKAIRQAVPGNKIIFSLDIADNRVLSLAGSLQGLPPLEALEILTAEGLDRFILLTLDAVGSGDGPAISLLQSAKRTFPRHTLIAGGGVKTPDHLQALSNAGADGVLVATSLHKGWITGRDILRLKHPLPAPPA